MNERSISQACFVSSSQLLTLGFFSSGTVLMERSVGLTFSKSKFEFEFEFEGVGVGGGLTSKIELRRASTVAGLKEA